MGEEGWPATFSLDFTRLKAFRANSVAPGAKGGKIGEKLEESGGKEGGMRGA